MSSPLSVALVGIGGYGNNYVSALLDAPDSSPFRLDAAIDPAPQLCNRLEELRARQVPLYPSLEAFFAEQQTDLTVVCSPLHLHATQTCMALRHGSHVLCEKPLCVTTAEAIEMATAEAQTGKQVAIGYQWSFSLAVQSLKRDILAGLFGRPLRLRTLVLWPRDETYYHRNTWAGRTYDRQGNPIFDSPVNNAAAHHLHNMLFVLGPQLNTSATPLSVTAELYRANPIENFDTAALRIATAENADLLFIVSHAVESRQGPLFHFEFENGVIEYADGPDAPITARFTDGSIKNYGSPNQDRMRKLWCMADSIQQNTPPLCGIAAASAHTQCVWAIQHSVPGTIPFPPELIDISGAPGHQQIFVRGLERAFTQCYEQWSLPSKLGVPWAQPSIATAVAKRGL